MSSLLSAIGAGIVTAWTAFKEFILPKLLMVLLGCALFTLVGSFLPSDPFRSTILAWASQIHPYLGLVNYFIPMGYIITSLIFCVAFYAFFFVLSALSSLLGWDWLSNLLNGGKSN